MDIKLNISSDYEKKSKRTLSENKPKQSQSFDFAQDKFQTAEIYPPPAGQMAEYKQETIDENGRYRTRTCDPMRVKHVL
jgi:hypothetical protein